MLGKRIREPAGGGQGRSGIAAGPRALLRYPGVRGLYKALGDRPVAPTARNDCYNDLAMTVRTRYAPSPTGDPHLGNIRTALFDWLLARRYGGQFILRIEDTDQARYVETGVDAQMDALRWLGLEWDEGPDVGGPHAPYVQSERLPLYHSHADRLLAEDKAYRCYCSPERLDQVRKEQQARKEPPRYDRHCRDLSSEERRAQEAAGLTPGVRFKTPPARGTQKQGVLPGEGTFRHQAPDGVR